jgi:hypothetical protein
MADKIARQGQFVRQCRLTKISRHANQGQVVRESHSTMFDTQRFLTENFRDADGVVGLFNAFRLEIPPRDTVRKWFSRGTIPSQWLPMLIAVAELEAGRPVSLARYVGGPK